MDKLGIKGEVSIEKLHLDTYEVYETMEPTCNDINWQTFALLLINTNASAVRVPIKTPSTGTIGSPWQIIWSQHNISQNISNVSVPIGDSLSETFGAAVNVNVGSPYFTPKFLITDKDYVTFVADILPGANTRTIKSLGLTNSSGELNLSYSNWSRSITNLNLTTPCIQSTSTVIRITYRLYLDDYAPSETISNVSDGYYYVLRNMLKEMSDGTYTGTDPIIVDYFNGILLSSFYDHDNIINLKPAFTSPGYTSQNVKFNDNGISIQDMATSGFVGYTNAYIYDGSFALSHLNSMGTFFRTLNLIGYPRYPNTTDGGGGDSTLCADTPFLYQRAIPTTVSPIKNVFKQISTAPGPFQDISYISSMSGTITLDSSSWVTKPFPKLVRLILTSDGDSSTSTYKFETLDFTGGFIGNTFCPRDATIPQDGLHTTLDTYHRKAPNEQVITEYVAMGGTTVRSLDDNTKFVAVSCQRTKDAISVYDIATGDKITLSPTSTPSLPVANTSDVAVSNGYIFVTCSTTGLWQIDPTLSTVINLNSIGGSIDATKAYQIDVKDNGDLWVLFEGGLAKGVTSDLGATWTWTVYDTLSSPAFNATGITNGNWANVSSMVIDKDHANDRIMFVTGSTATENTNASSFIWWEGSTGTTTIQTTGLAYPTFSLASNLKKSDLMKCSNGYWFTNIGGDTDDTTTINKATFGSLSWTNNELSTSWTNNELGTGILSSGRITPATVAGIPGIFIGSSNSHYTNVCWETPAFFVKNTNISALPSSILDTTPQIEFFTKFGELDTTTTNISTYASASLINNGAIPIVYLPNSNMMVYHSPDNNTFSICPLVINPAATNYNDFKSACWKTYGWDTLSSSWVLGEPNSKTCHSTPDDLIDGITIRFNNGGSAPHFTNTNQFMFVIGDGIMKDNATLYNFKYTYYPSATERVSEFYTQTSGQVTTVPNYRYGYMTDEFVNFSGTLPDGTGGGGVGISQSRGRVSGQEQIQSNFRVSDQLIPANTPFTFKYKLITDAPGAYNDVGKKIMLYSYSGSYYIQYQLYRDGFGNYNILDIWSNVFATIPLASLSISTDMTIERGNDNKIYFYYGSKLIYTSPAQLSAELEIGVDMVWNNDTSLSTMGFYDMRISYHELRRMVKIGNDEAFTGHFNPNFTGTTTTTLANDASVTVNNITRTIVNKTSAESISGLEVKIGSGCGYLVFGNMPVITFTDTGSPITGPSLAPVISGGIVTGVDIISTGSGFATTPTITFEAPLSGVTATATIALTAMKSLNDFVTITTAGTGYTDGTYSLIVSGGGGIGAAGTVVITDGTVKRVNISDGGWGYTSTPALSFIGAGSPTVAAVLTGDIGYRINTVTVTDGGTGYITDSNTSLVGYATAHYLP